METETAWSPCIETYDFICQKFPSLNYYYRSEEPMMAEYLTNDSDGRYFKERYIAEASAIYSRKKMWKPSMSNGILATTRDIVTCIITEWSKQTKIKRTVRFMGCLASVPYRTSRQYICCHILACVIIT